MPDLRENEVSRFRPFSPFLHDCLKRCGAAERRSRIMVVLLLSEHLKHVAAQHLLWAMAFAIPSRNQPSKAGPMPIKPNGKELIHRPHAALAVSMP
jgi:hypothetical protein